MITIINKNSPQFKSNLHCHSTLSDGKLTPEQLKAAYRSHGYSVLAITDHEHPYDHTAMSEPDFLMLTGYEAHIRQPFSEPRFKPYVHEVHINMFARDPHNITHINPEPHYCHFVTDPEELARIPTVSDGQPRRYAPDYINSFYKSAAEHGYICTLNHPVWSMEDHEQIMQYQGFFSMEICNYASFAGNRTEYNAPLYDRMLREGKRVFCHAADDNHNSAPIDSCRSDSFGAFTMILADDLSYDSVFSALENGRFYASMGPIFTHLTVDGNKVHVEVESPVRQITMFFGAKGTRRVLGDAQNPVSSADFVIPDEAPFFRIDAYDFEGNHASTRGFFRDELGI